MLDREDVIELLPEINWIKSETLKEGVVNSWLEAAKIWNWNKNELKQLPFVLTELKDCPVTLTEHIRNVTVLATLLGDQLSKCYGEFLKIEQDFILAGALLHDLGKLSEYSYVGGKYVFSKQGKLLRHPIAGSMLAFKNGVPIEVCHIIAVHSFEGEKSNKSPEAFIVRNADWINFDFLAYNFPSQINH